MDPDDRRGRAVEARGGAHLAGAPPARGGGGGGGGGIHVHLREASPPHVAYDSLVAALLHELTRNVFGAHGAQFWRLTCAAHSLLRRGARRRRRAGRGGLPF
jgi:hypothetical protein